jgi:type I restriction enzyme M protein
LGLIFLKYISDTFKELHEKLKSGVGEYTGADPEGRDEYKAEKVFFVPPSALWSFLQSRAKLPEIGKDVDLAMDSIERVKELDYVLTPGRYMCLPNDEDDFEFNE